jgi:hypothetical protein
MFRSLRCHPGKRRLPDMKARWDAMVVTPEARPQPEWPGYLAAERSKWRTWVRTLNITVQ